MVSQVSRSPQNPTILNLLIATAYASNFFLFFFYCNLGVFLINILNALLILCMCVFFWEWIWMCMWWVDRYELGLLGVTSRKLFAVGGTWKGLISVDKSELGLLEIRNYCYLVEEINFCYVCVYNEWRNLNEVYVMIRICNLVEEINFCCVCVYNERRNLNEVYLMIRSCYLAEEINLLCVYV